MSEERLMKLLLSPHVSEKSTRIADKNRQFVFKVVPDATKPEIKQAVEGLFKVKVKAVNTSVLKGKVKRFRGFVGQRDDVKKAIVTLAEGEMIDNTSGI